jgi:hypothetical protein
MNHHSRTVLLVENGLLLSAGLKHLLTSDPHLCVVSTIFHDIDDLIEQIVTYQPEVVVLTAGLVCTQWDKLHTCLQNCKRLRLVVINLEDDCINVYDKHQVVVTKAGDLLTIVRENTATRGTSGTNGNRA